MHVFPAKTVIASTRKIRCTYCGESVEVGETYLRYASIDDSWFTNKLHQECAKELEDWGWDGYAPYENQRPKRLT